MFDVKDRRAIVTGAARGFGKEFVRRLLAAGAKVVVSDVDVDEANKTVEEFGKQFGKDNVAFVKCDVRSEQEWESLWTESEKALGGPISILGNNAGVAPASEQRKNWRMVIDINYTGVCIGTYLALEKMSTKNGGEGGRIVNTASVAGIIAAELGDIYASTYTSSKFGVVGLTRYFADRDADVEGQHGVKAYALCPWFADTKLVRDAIDMNTLKRQTGERVLTVEEVGAAFMTALRTDKNGACYGVYPDAPVFEVPEVNRTTFMTYVVASKILRLLGMHDPAVAVDGPGYVLRGKTVTLVMGLALFMLILFVKFLALMIDIFIF